MAKGRVIGGCLGRKDMWEKGLAGMRKFLPAVPFSVSLYCQPGQVQQWDTGSLLGSLGTVIL